MADTLFCDISHWNGAVNWTKFRAATPYLYGAIFKSSQGSITCPYAVDDRFHSNKLSCIQAKIPFAAYHYFDPRYDSVAQADHFVNTVGSGCTVYVADIETAVIGYNADGTKKFSPSPADMMSRAKKFCERVYNTTGRKPMIYTSWGFWNQWCMGVTNWWGGYPLWVAHYTSNSYPTLPTGWTSWKMWQFTSKGDGTKYGTDSLDLDMNRYQGTPGQLVEYFGNGELPSGVPVPPVPILPRTVTVFADALNIRYGAGTQFADIGDTPKGAVLDVEGMEFDSSGKTWYKISGYVSGDWVTPNGAQSVAKKEDVTMSAVRLVCGHCGSKFYEDRHGNCLACGAPQKV